MVWRSQHQIIVELYYVQAPVHNRYWLVRSNQAYKIRLI